MKRDISSYSLCGSMASVAAIVNEKVTVFVFLEEERTRGIRGRVPVWRIICGRLGCSLSMISRASFVRGAILGAQRQDVLRRNGKDDSRCGIHEAQAVTDDVIPSPITALSV